MERVASTSYASAVMVLESLLRRLLSTSWDETIRRQATAKAAGIATFEVAEAPRHARAISRGIVSLLSLRDAADLRPQIGQRLLELIACLRDADSAGGAAPGA
jgi:hypothetical protein